MTPWPYDDTMHPAGALGEWELDAACWRKRQVVLTQEQCAAVDETAGLCGVCGGECRSPQACEQPENVSGFPLEPLLTAYPWLGPLLLSIVCFVWLCVEGYLENLP